MGSIAEHPDHLVVSAAPLPPFKVLVIGGSYGGLSAALNVQDLCSARPPRCGEPPKEGEPPLEHFQVAVDITIVDERDGFCRPPPSPVPDVQLMIDEDHLIGTPLTLADDSFAEKAWVKYEDIVALRPRDNDTSIQVLQGSVNSIDTKHRVATFVARRQQSMG